MHSLPFSIPFLSLALSLPCASAISAGFPLDPSGCEPFRFPSRSDAIRALWCLYLLISRLSFGCYVNWNIFTNCLKICCFFLSIFSNNSCAHLALRTWVHFDPAGGSSRQLEDAAATTAIANIRPEVVTQNWKLCGRRFSRKIKHTHQTSTSTYRSPADDVHVAASPPLKFWVLSLLTLDHVSHVAKSKPLTLVYDYTAQQAASFLWY